MTTTAILNNLFNSIQLRKDSNLIKENLDPLSFVKRHESDTPVETVKADWEAIDYDNYSALNKTFNFELSASFNYFISEILSESQRLDHDFKMIIEGRKIEIFLYTMDYNQITAIDIKLSKIINEIHEDLKFLRDV